MTPKLRRDPWRRDHWRRDRGDLMLWVAVAAPFLLLGLLTLVSASRQWEMRREAHAVAAAAARAGAQPDDAVLRRSNDLSQSHSSIADLQLVRRRVADVVNTKPGAVLLSVTVRRLPSDRSPLDRSSSVTVEVAIPITPVVPVPGMASSVVGTATAVAVEQSVGRP